MRQAISVFLAVLCTLCSSCTTASKCAGLTGTYRCGSDPNNAEYLTLNPTGSFTLVVYSTCANGLDNLAPAAQSTIYGTWRPTKGEIALAPTNRPANTPFVTRYRILGKAAKDGLQHVYGAGYIPPYKFIRIDKNSMPKT